VAPRATKDTWRTHELVTKAIYEALLKQSNPEQWDIKHDTKLFGLKTCHQIDVYWKFRVANFEHFVIVQVKKKKEPVKQGDLLLFSAVLHDIPGQPKGVFISQTGYQKGALKVARSLGIDAFELRKIDQISSYAVTMNYWSVGTLAPRKDMMAWEITILQPVTVENIILSVDEQWVEQHYPATRSLAPTPGQAWDAAKFVDSSGNERTSILALVKDLLIKFKNAGRAQLDVTFPEPTYLTGIESVDSSGVRVDTPKICKIAATVDVVKTTTIFPMFSHSTTTYLLKNAIENDHRYALVSENGPELKAQVLLHPGVLTVSQSPPPRS
jgi:hypothetical protein